MADDYSVTPDNRRTESNPIRATDLNRQQAEIRKQIKDMKGSCTELEDDDEAVQCLSETKEFEDTMSDVFRSEENTRKMEQVSGQEEDRISIL